MSFKLTQNRKNRYSKYNLDSAKIVSVIVKRRNDQDSSQGYGNTIKITRIALEKSKTVKIRHR